MRAGGLGLRSVSDLSFAAYIASFNGAAGLAQRIDGAFDPEDAQNLCGMQDVALGLAAKVRPEAAVDLSAGVKQKKLSVLIDAKSSSDKRSQGETGFTCSTWRCRPCTAQGFG